MYVLASASSNASCNFDDIDICGYQDLSDSGINWSQIHNQSETISYCIYQSCIIIVQLDASKIGN